MPEGTPGLTTGSPKNMMRIILMQGGSMSRTPNSQKEATHERIVDVAARALRRNGYAGVGVAEVMKAAAANESSGNSRKI